jgi:hypothetical protein
MLELPTFWLLGVKSFKSLAASDTLSRNNNRVIFCPFACFATFCLILFVFFCPSNLCCLLSRTVEVRTFQNEERKSRNGNQRLLSRRSRFNLVALNQNGLWLSLVERHVRDVEAVGSNPTSPTKTDPAV